MKSILLVLAATVGVGGLAAADPWKDESGKRKWRDSYGWQDDGPRRSRERQRAERIPRGHLPPPGECRTWYRGVPPGHQPPPYRC
jgi:hypothetical protein